MKLKSGSIYTKRKLIVYQFDICISKCCDFCIFDYQVYKLFLTIKQLVLVFARYFLPDYPNMRKET